MRWLRARLSKLLHSRWAFLMAYFELVLLALIWVHFDRYAHACLFIGLCLTGFFVLCFAMKKVSAHGTRLFFGTSSVLLLITLCLSFMPCIPLLSGGTRYRDVDVPRDSLFAGQEVMVIVPHQDDELILLTGVLEQYVQAGSEVTVVFTTNGDYYGLGRRRIQEAINVLGRLGIDGDHVVFLGYGDQWTTSFKHIYHAPDEALVRSHAGRYVTYGSARHAPYEIAPYTRENLVTGLTGVIAEFLPDTLFCIDYDSHPDHRATSLFFDEAMLRVLRQQTGYAPTVYKGFAYSLGWFGVDDYYETNIRSSVLQVTDDLMPEVGVYRWSERVRFPVASRNLSRALFNSPAYNLLKQYASQAAQARASRIINGDKVFFTRYTASVTYSAQVTATSGDASLLNDFKLYDSSDVTRADLAPDTGVWVPDATDAERRVTVRFAEPVTLSQIMLYDNPSMQDNVLHALIALSDGTQVDTGLLPANGSAAKIALGTHEGIEWFTVELLETSGEQAGLTEIEAYSEVQTPSARFIKLMNREGDFVYDYLIDSSGEEDFTLYTYGLEEGAAERLRIQLDNDACSAVLVNGALRITCPKGEGVCLTVSLPEDGGETLCDRVYLSNPPSSRRLLLSFTQWIEKCRYRLNFECEGEYYSEVYRFAKEWFQERF